MGLRVIKALSVALLISGGVFLLYALGQTTQDPAAPPEASARPAASPPQARPAAKPADFELAREKQEEIWDAEHVTFEIEHRLGDRLKAAIRKGDGDLLAELLCDDFRGHVLAGEGRRRTQAGIEERVQEAGSHEAVPVTATGLVESLGEVIGRFASCDSVGMRVLSIDRIEDDLWETRLLLTIAGPRPEEGKAEFESTQRALLRFAEDEALGSEPVVASWNEENRRFRTRAAPIFEEATKVFGLDRVDIPDNWNLPHSLVQQYRFQIAAGDFDADGWLDLALATHHRSFLLRRDPRTGRFLDVTYDMGIQSRHTPLTKPADLENYLYKPVDLAGWIDFDNDGYPDLILGNRLYHNEKGRRFRDITRESEVSFEMQSIGVLVADYDGDGLLDFYILQQAHEGANRDTAGKKLSWVSDNDNGAPNRLWRNEGGGRFRDVSEEARAGGGARHSLAGTWFFYDEDHHPDLYIANDFGENVLLRNRGDGTFQDRSELSETADFATSMGVASGDTNNDGTSDLYVANMYSKMGRRIIGHVCEQDYPPGIFEQIQGSCAGNRLYRRAPGEMAFTEHGSEFGVDGVGWAYGPAMADFDNDGWLDLYATTGFLSFERGKPDG